MHVFIYRINVNLSKKTLENVSNISTTVVGRQEAGGATQGTRKCSRHAPERDAGHQQED